MNYFDNYIYKGNSMIKKKVALELVLKGERWAWLAMTLVWIAASLFIGHLMYVTWDIAPNYSAYARSLGISFCLIYVTVQSFKKHRKQSTVRGRK